MNVTKWEAKPHTLAKITILRKYLDAWFSIMGRSANDSDLFYIDGFAGPGRYDGGEAGSPIVAIDSAIGAIGNAMGTQSWKAGKVNCLFIDADKDTISRLANGLASVAKHSWVREKIYRGEFDSVIERIEQEFPNAFGNCPLFVFLDPFGATGLSFRTVANILSSPKSEVLLHFDHDGAARIISSLNKGHNKGAAESLTRVFGDDSWIEIAQLQLREESSFDEMTRALIKLYMGKLRSIAEFAYPFQMITPRRRETSEIGYYLIFASNHSRGLEKMKEAMKSVGHDGQYKFSNFRSQRPMLFVDADDVAPDADLLWQTFGGRSGVIWAEIQRFILNETRFTNPREMLKYLEKAGILVIHAPEDRKKNTYPPRFEKVISFDFSDQKGHVDG